jgi:hypothetical protein
MELSLAKEINKYRLTLEARWLNSAFRPEERSVRTEEFAFAMRVCIALCKKPWVYLLNVFTTVFKAMALAMQFLVVVRVLATAFLSAKPISFSTVDPLNSRRKRNRLCRKKSRREHADNNEKLHGECHGLENRCEDVQQIHPWFFAKRNANAHCKSEFFRSHRPLFRAESRELLRKVQFKEFSKDRV